VKKAIKTANHFAEKEGVKSNYKSILGDFLNYNFSEKFDLIVSIHTQFTPNHEGYHKKLVDLLNDEGVYFTLQYSPKQLLDNYKTGGPRDIKHFYDIETNELTQDFKKIIMEADWMKNIEDKKLKQEPLQFASYIVKEILPLRKKDTFNQDLPFNEFEFSKQHIDSLLHSMNIDKNKVKIYKDSDIDAPDYLKERCHPGKPSIKFIYQP